MTEEIAKYETKPVTNAHKVRSQAQIKAEKTYAKKKANEDMIPRVRLISDSEKLLAKTVFKLHGGTKKQAILEGLKLLINKLNKQ